LERGLGKGVELPGDTVVHIRFSRVRVRGVRSGIGKTRAPMGTFISVGSDLLINDTSRVHCSPLTQIARERGQISPSGTPRQVDV
jgi:hypothetical protein